MPKRKPAHTTIKSFVGFSLLACGTFILAGCDQQTPSSSTEQVKKTTILTTQVSYSDRSMMRPGSQLIVTLSDVSKMDVRVDIISQQILDITKTPPYTVDLVYDASKINSKHRYNLSARIINKDRVLYTSAAHHNPFTESKPTNPYKIELSEASTNKPNVDLVNTYWKAKTLNAEQVNVITKEPFIQFDKNNKVHGFLGCNNFTASYQLDKQTITFNQLGSTKKMCSEAMDQETALSKALNKSAQWQVTGETLTLNNSDGKRLATFGAVYF